MAAPTTLEGKGAPRRKRNRAVFEAERSARDLALLNGDGAAAALWVAQQCGVDDRPVRLSKSPGAPGSSFVLSATQSTAADAALPKLVREFSQSRTGGAKRARGVEVLVLTLSATVAAELGRALKDGSGALVKLFGRHLKMDEQAAALLRASSKAAKRPVVAVGTPERTHALLNAGALDSERIHCLALDLRFNLKHMTLLDAPDARDSVCAVVAAVWPHMRRLLLLLPSPESRLRRVEAKKRGAGAAEEEEITVEMDE